MRLSPRDSVRSEPPSPSFGPQLHPPLNFFDDFAFVLLTFLEQSAPSAEQPSSTQSLPERAGGTVARASLDGLQRLLKRAQCVMDRQSQDGDCVDSNDGAFSPAQSSSLYLLRLKQLLEEQVHSSQAAKLGLGAASPSAQGTPAAGCLPLPPPTAAELSQQERHKAVVIHSNGRRYSTAPPDGPRPLAQAGVQTPKASRTERGASALPTEEVASVAVAACHGQLLLQVQQHLLGAVSFIEKCIAAEAEKHHGLRGIVTEELAETLQSTFLSTLLMVLGHVADVVHEGSCGRGVEVALACDEVTTLADRVGSALSAPVSREAFANANRSHRCPSHKIVVHEARGGDSGGTNPFVLGAGPPPFFPGIDTGEKGNLASGFGVLGTGFGAKLIAQHVWCYQCILHQRFPSFNGSWSLLERARFFAESLRSPTPTVPRSHASSPSSASSSPAALGTEAPTVPVDGQVSVFQGTRHDSHDTSSCSFASVSTSPSPVIRRGTMTAHTFPGTHTIDPSNDSRANDSASASQQNTPTRPPPAVDHTQEKSAKANAASSPPPSPTIATAKVLLGEYDGANGTARADRTDAAADAVNVASIAEHQGLAQRLEPCLLFDTFLDRVMGQDAKWHRPPPRAGHSHDAHRTRSCSSTGRAGATGPARTPLRQPRTASTSPIPLQPLPTVNALPLPRSCASNLATVESPSVVTKTRPSSASTQRSPSQLPGQ